MSDESRGVRVGVDIGGTFTDVVLSDPSTGRLTVTKTPTTPSNFEEGVLTGIEKITATAGVAPDEIAFLSHATTVATNAVIEETFPPVGLITTAGFRDVIEIGKQVRPDPFDLQEDKPPALIPRQRRLGVPGRIDATGEYLEPLDESAVRAAVQELADRGIESIVVSLLFSYLNDAHEQRVGEIIEEFGLTYALSSAVHPERREYERTITTVINESVKRVIQRYLSRAECGLIDRGVETPMNVMHCGGGVFSVEQAIDRAIRTITSGPAAGAVATQRVTTAESFENAIGLDMGGTSADVSIIRNGDIVRSTENEINELPVEIPMVDINAVGAGGGSIARVDAGGALRVGPDSAGADPGPVCYGKGGERPTITDANLVLGRLNPDRPIADGIDLDVAAARSAIESEIADPMGIDVEEAALSVLEVAYAVLTRNIRKVTIERGHDPEDFALVGFGGMGPQVALDVAAEMGMNTVIVPRNPGVFSARGLLMADFRIQEAKSFPAHDTIPAGGIEEFSDLRDAILDRMRAQGFDPGEVRVEYSADMRYEGQAYQLTVPLSSGTIDAETIEAGTDDFHRHHERRYGYSVEENDVHITTMRVTGVVPADDTQTTLEVSEQEPHTGRRSIHFAETGAVTADVYERTALEPGTEIAGPAVIEEADSSTVLPPETTARVSERGNLIVSLDGDR